MTDEEKALAVRSKLSGQFYVGQRVRFILWQTDRVRSGVVTKVQPKLAVKLDDGSAAIMVHDHEIIRD